jgi:nitrogen regulatory protein PII
MYSQIHMKLIKAIIRPNKVDEVRQALEKASLSGMTVTEVRGHGRQKGHKAVYRGREYDVSLLPKTMIEMVVADEVAEEVVRIVIQTARTGDIGDGRIFVLPIEEGHNIRTGLPDTL